MKADCVHHLFGLMSLKLVRLFYWPVPSAFKIRSDTPGPGAQARIPNDEQKRSSLGILACAPGPPGARHALLLVISLLEQGDNLFFSSFTWV